MHVLQVGFLAPAILAIIIIGYIWISHQYHTLFQETRDREEQLRALSMTRIQEEVANAMEFVDYMRSQTEDRLKTSIKSRTYEAYAIASYIFRQNADKSREEIAHLVHEALKPIQFNNGRGYYFAFNSQGVNLLHPAMPELENTYIGDMRTEDGRRFILEMVELATKHGETYYEYAFSKPGAPKGAYRKIAFVKYFAPLDWYFGTGEYLDDVEKDVQEEVLKRLGQVRFGQDGYLFAATYGGVSLLGPEKGLNILEAKGHWGREIVAKLIATAKTGGGYVHYSIPLGKDSQLVEKASYVQGIPSWEWYVGAGMNIPDLKKELETQTILLEKSTNSNVLAIFLVLTLATVAVLLVSYLVGKRVNKSFLVFEGFFAEAAYKGGVIDLNRLHFKDFTNLAISANEMLLHRRQAENEARVARTYLQDMINSMPSIIIGTEKDGRVHLWNRKAEQITGVSAANALGEMLDRVFPNLSSYMDYMKRAIQDKQVRKEEKNHHDSKWPCEFFGFDDLPLGGGGDRRGRYPS